MLRRSSETPAASCSGAPGGGPADDAICSGAPSGGCVVGRC